MKPGERLKSLGAKKSVIRKNILVWKGPEEDGITFSLLSRFLVCRERFRLLVIEGLKPADDFNHHIEYGNMWHLCEEWHAKGNDPTRGNRDDRSKPLWEDALYNYARDLCNRYRMQQEQVLHWYEVCKKQFPYYVNFWEGSRSFAGTSIIQEESFRVPYTLPSGRVVTLRGKWDGVCLMGRGAKKNLYLYEHKTKGEIIEDRLKKQLTFDLQTMLYIVAYQTWQDLDDYGQPIRFPLAVGHPMVGVIYNVIRRPLSGGRGTIIRHKPSKSNPEGESKESFYNRLAEYFENEPEYYFMRWQVEVSKEDVERFKKECLNPILEQLCDWWEVMQMCAASDRAGSPFEIRGIESDSSIQAVHWRHPFGVRNILDEGGSSELDDYLESGSELGLQRTDNLFPELT